MWSGAANAIPTGYVLCDGGNGTPDLRDRFVVGAGNSYAVNATGGAASVTLTIAEMPAHTHTTEDQYVELVAQNQNRIDIDFNVDNLQPRTVTEQARQCNRWRWFSREQTSVLCSLLCDEDLTMMDSRTFSHVMASAITSVGRVEHQDL